jgi:hypothetical protein
MNKSVKNAEVEIEGYKIFRLDRKDKRGEGVCAYIRSPLRHKYWKTCPVHQQPGFNNFGYKFNIKRLDHS